MFTHSLRSSHVRVGSHDGVRSPHARPVTRAGNASRLGTGRRSDDVRRITEAADNLGYDYLTGSPPGPQMAHLVGAVDPSSARTPSRTWSPISTSLSTATPCPRFRNGSNRRSSSRAPRGPGTPVGTARVVPRVVAPSHRFAMAREPGEIVAPQVGHSETEKFRKVLVPQRDVLSPSTKTQPMPTTDGSGRSDSKRGKRKLTSDTSVHSAVGGGGSLLCSSTRTASGP